MSEPLDLDAIEARWSGDGGMGNGRSADDYTDAGCRIFAEYAFDEVPALIARIRDLKERNTNLGRSWARTVAELGQLRQTTKPRVLEGDWETVRDALDALPEGAQIRWQEGHPLHSFMGMKTTSVFGDTRWSSVGSDGSFDHLSSAGIAHNDSPIEVLA